MQMMIFTCVALEEKLGAIQAARIARFLRFEAELPYFGVSVVFAPGLPIGRELGVQIPELFSIKDDERLCVPPHLVFETVGSLMTISTSVLIVGAGAGFVAKARSFLEGDDSWEGSEPVVSPAIMFYDLATRRMRYVDFKKNPDRALWRSF
jgi:hypothetical protein